MTVVIVNKAEDIPKAPIDGKPTLVYWNIVGLGQQLRLALVAAGVDFVDVRMDDSDNGEEWQKAKKDLDESGVLTFPNLPYFLDGKVSLSQSGTILRYIASEYGNLNNPGPLLDISYGAVSLAHLAPYMDLISDQVHDATLELVGLAYHPEAPDKIKEWYLSGSVVPLLKKFESLDEIFWQKATGQDGVTTAHLKFYVYLLVLGIIQKEFGNEESATFLTDWCKAFMKRIEGLPKLREYMESSDYIKSPLTGATASWRGVPTP